VASAASNDWTDRVGLRRSLSLLDVRTADPSVDGRGSATSRTAIGGGFRLAARGGDSLFVLGLRSLCALYGSLVDLVVPRERSSLLRAARRHSVARETTRSARGCDASSRQITSTTRACIPSSLEVLRSTWVCANGHRCCAGCCDTLRRHADAGETTFLEYLSRLIFGDDSLPLKCPVCRVRGPFRRAPDVDAAVAAHPAR